MGPSRISWGMVLLAVGSAGAWAERLDKSACNVLKVELGGIIATGARDDMERGPEWAKANLSREKLHNIYRLIELEEKLEFRCGLSRRRVAATAPAKVDKVVIPEEPERKPESSSSATKSTPAQSGAARPISEVVKTVSRTPAEQNPGPQKPTPPKTTAATTQPTAAGSGASAKAAAAPAQAASEKSSRRRSGPTYVSPAEVNPYFVTRYGDTH